MVIKEELNPQKLIKLYPSEFNYLFKKFPSDINPNIQKKWAKIACSDVLYIGQINCSNGELEGRGVFYWKTGIRYIGCFNKNKLHGYGILIDKESKKVFEVSTAPMVYSVTTWPFCRCSLAMRRAFSAVIFT